MKKITVSVKVNKELLNKYVTDFQDQFVEFGQKTLLEVDFDKCVDDYIEALLILDQNIIVVE